MISWKSKWLHGLAAAYFVGVGLTSLLYSSSAWQVNGSPDDLRVLGILSLLLFVLGVGFLILGYLFWRMIISQNFFTEWDGEKKTTLLSAGLFLSILPLAISIPLLQNLLLAAPLAFLFGIVPFIYFIRKDNKN